MKKRCYVATIAQLFYPQNEESKIQKDDHDIWVVLQKEEIKTLKVVGIQKGHALWPSVAQVLLEQILGPVNQLSKMRMLSLAKVASMRDCSNIQKLKKSRTENRPSSIHHDSSHCQLHGFENLFSDFLNIPKKTICESIKTQKHSKKSLPITSYNLKLAEPCRTKLEIKFPTFKGVSGQPSTRPDSMSCHNSASSWQWRCGLVFQSRAKDKFNKKINQNRFQTTKLTPQIHATSQNHNISERLPPKAPTRFPNVYKNNQDSIKPPRFSIYATIAGYLSRHTCRGFCGTNFNFNAPTSFAKASVLAVFEEQNVIHADNSTMAFFQ